MAKFGVTRTTKRDTHHEPCIICSNWLAQLDELDPAGPDLNSCYVVVTIVVSEYDDLRTGLVLTSSTRCQPWPDYTHAPKLAHWRSAALDGVLMCTIMFTSGYGITTLYGGGYLPRITYIREQGYRVEAVPRRC